MENQTPTPAGDAFMDNTRGVWLQDYNVWDGQTMRVVRYMYNGTEWVVDPQSNNMQNNYSQTNDHQANGSQSYSNQANGSQSYSNQTNSNQSEDEMTVKLTKDIPNTTAGISLKKSVINLNKSLIDLSKNTGIDLGKHKSRVAVVMDYSGSMRRLYTEGAVQRVLTRLMPLALRFDDNGELDIWLFNHTYMQIDSMTLRNFDDYVNRVAMQSGFNFGATAYAPVLEDVLSNYFPKPSLIGGLFANKQNSNNEPPVFVIFITDGANSDRAATNDVIRRSAEKDIFIQFVGIGNETFEYLQKLDDLTDRAVDNTGFIKVEDFEKLDDEQVYHLLLSQYPEWLKAKGLR